MKRALDVREFFASKGIFLTETFVKEEKTALDTLYNSGWRPGMGNMMYSNRVVARRHFKAEISEDTLTFLMEMYEDLTPTNRAAAEALDNYRLLNKLGKA